MVLSGAKGEQVNNGAQGEVQRKEQHQQAAAADAHAGCPRFLRRGVRLRPEGATPRQGAGDGELPAVHGSAGDGLAFNECALRQGKQFFL